MSVYASDTFFKVHMGTPTGASVTLDDDSIPDQVIQNIYDGHLEIAAAHLSAKFGLRCTVVVEHKVTAEPEEVADGY